MEYVYSEPFEPVLTGSIQFLRQVFTLKSQPNAINIRDIRVPTMGPKLREARARPLYEDAIFQLIQEDDDVNSHIKDDEGPVTRGTRGRGRGRGRGGGRGKVHIANGQVEHVDPGPEPPTDASEERSQRRREKQREDRHARNQAERESHNIDNFFGGSTPPPPPATPPPDPPPQPRTPTLDRQADPPTSVWRVVVAHIIRTPASPFGRPRGAFTNVTLSPISNPLSRTRRPAIGAPDVWEFFTKGNVAKGVKTICKLCYPPVEYSPSMSTGSLRVHIEAYHAYEYLAACQEKGWPVKIKSLTLSKSDQKVTTQPEPRPPFSTGQFKAA
ncbi:hypothetical protein JB92DRAFT_3092746, partial [Gautieria morchelliformis]